ncbi:hypothetical protein [Microbulbifer sp. THAF38]|uniref:hypothetical protein n=1 Tax=Microbulbifer sp. THAF38 TaxID=2587856 RepID=UPI00126819EA|nr:hypothetical protein [Microbulbifer sp. THAF38]QFT53985.1 hypothetical protein FIU95_05315 [Microbulbifer sp. THAF38]
MGLKKLSPREMKAMESFEKYGRVSREQLDRATRSSNSPDIIFQLRKKGYPIKTYPVPHIDAYGKKGVHGDYEAMPEALDAFYSLREAANDAVHGEAKSNET